MRFLSTIILRRAICLLTQRALLSQQKLMVFRSVRISNMHMTKPEMLFLQAAVLFTKTGHMALQPTMSMTREEYQRYSLTEAQPGTVLTVAMPVMSFMRTAS